MSRIRGGYNTPFTLQSLLPEIFLLYEKIIFTVFSTFYIQIFRTFFVDNDIHRKAFLYFTSFIQRHSEMSLFLGLVTDQDVGWPLIW